MTTIGIESSAALATPVAALVRPGAKMRQDDAGLAGHARVAVRGVRGDLFVSGRDESHPALAERIEHADDGVSAEAEDHLDPKLLEIVGDLIGRDAGASRENCARDRPMRKCAHVPMFP